MSPTVRLEFKIGRTEDRKKKGNRRRVKGAGKKQNL
jgi:hypothetical protein